MEKFYPREFITMLVLATISLFLIQDQYLAWVSMLAIGVFQYYLVAILHECVHLNFLENKKMSRAIGKWVGASIFISFEAYQLEHRAHHRHTSTDKDPDKYIYHYKGDMKLTSIIPWIIYKGFFEAFKKQRTKGVLAYSHIVGIARILLAQTVLFFFFYYLCEKSWSAYFTFWTAPLLSIAFFINRTRIILEHGFGRFHSEGIDFKVSNSLVRMIFFPFAFNYHHAHHKYPALPAYQHKKQKASLSTNKLTLGELYQKFSKEHRIKFYDFSAKGQASSKPN